MSGIGYYFDRIADEFNGYYTGRRPSFIQEAGYRIFRGPGLKRRFADAVGIIGECRGENILDVGCGPGVYTLYFMKKGARVTAIDLSPRMVELVRKNLLDEGLNDFRIMLGDFLACEFADTFDYTIAIGVFDYIHPEIRDDYFAKMSRITHKKIIATFPKLLVFQMPIRWALFLMKRQPVFFYSSGMIRAIAGRHDLKPIFHNSGPIWTVEFCKR